MKIACVLVTVCLAALVSSATEQESPEDPQNAVDPAQNAIQTLHNILQQLADAANALQAPGQGGQGPNSWGQGRRNGRGRSRSRSQQRSQSTLVNLQKQLEKSLQSADKVANSLNLLVRLISKLPGITDEQKQQLVVNLGRETLLRTCNAVVNISGIVGPQSSRAASFIAACNDIFETLIAPPTTAAPATTMVGV